METIQTRIAESLRYISYVGVSDIVDILLVAFLLFEALLFIQKTNSYKVARGIIILLLIMWLSGVLKLTVINFIIRKAFEIGLLAIVVIFQPELRRALEKMGSSSRLAALLGKDTVYLDIDAAIKQVVIACTEMSRDKTGALIIFERDNSLSDQMSTGTIVDADTTGELLKCIFYPKNPLHDGAVIVRGGRIAAAACMLPMSGNMNLSRDLGMRHRAGIGMSEKSDAVVVIVSEETGAISVAVDGMLKRHLSQEVFEKILRNELIHEPTESKKGGLFSILKRVNEDGK